MTPSARSLKHLRDNGYLCESVERFNSFTKRRNDYLGFVDIIAIKEGETVAVQTTSLNNIKSRYNKIINECRDAALMWIKAGNKIIIHGWNKRLIKRGGKAMRWTVKEVEITASDLS